MDRVLAAEAEDAFKEKNFERAAILFAQTQRSLEEVCLRFVLLRFLAFCSALQLHQRRQH